MCMFLYKYGAQVWYPVCRRLVNIAFKLNRIWREIRTHTAQQQHAARKQKRNVLFLVDRCRACKNQFNGSASFFFFLLPLCRINRKKGKKNSLTVFVSRFICYLAQWIRLRWKGSPIQTNSMASVSFIWFQKSPLMIQHIYVICNSIIW